MKIAQKSQFLLCLKKFVFKNNRAIDKPVRKCSTYQQTIPNEKKSQKVFKSTLTQLTIKMRPIKQIMYKIITLCS